jgi:hypothetical protein
MSMRRTVRQKQRGAAMTEFVLLMPVIIAMWMGIEYFRSGYARRLEALGQSQTAAWKLAYANDLSCYKQGGVSWDGVAGGLADLGAGGGDKANEAINEFSNSSKDSSMFLYGHVAIGRTMSTTKRAWEAGKPNGAVAGQTYITCNEVVPSADNSQDQNVITPLKSFITNVFNF